MITGRIGLESWASVLRIKVGVRDILSGCWSPDLLLLEHFLVVFSTVGKRLLLNLIRLSWRVHKHLPWALCCCLFLVLAPDFLLHRIIKGLLIFFGRLSISLPLLSSVEVALGVGLDTWSFYFSLLLA